MAATAAARAAAKAAVGSVAAARAVAGSVAAARAARERRWARWRRDGGGGLGGGGEGGGEGGGDGGGEEPGVNAISTVEGITAFAKPKHCQIDFLHGALGPKTTTFL